MKGLLLKDMYMLAKYARSAMAVILCLIIVSAVQKEGLSYFNVLPCIMAGIIPITLLAYDETEKWDVFAQTMPYTKAQIVSTKYLIALAAGLSVSLLSAVVDTCASYRTQPFALGGFFTQILLLILYILAAPAQCLPFIFKLGMAKGRLIYMVVLGLSCGGAAFLMSSEQLPAITKMFSPASISIIGAGLYLLSWLLSIHFYKQREL